MERESFRPQHTVQYFCVHPAPIKVSNFTAFLPTFFFSKCIFKLRFFAKFALYSEIVV